MSSGMIEFKANGRMAKGYLAIPASGKGPGVIVLQEWWGLVPHILNVADRLAAEGFVALAPDLYQGQSTKSPDEAQKLMMSMNIAETEKDLRGAVQYLLDHPSTAGNGKIGTVGFCMGGMLSLYAATQNSQVGACVVLYGVHPAFTPELSKLRAPVLGIYGENDPIVTPDKVRELEAHLKAAGKQAEIIIYPNAGHAFFNDERPDAYHKQHAADAWKRVLGFFRQHLGQTTMSAAS